MPLLSRNQLRSHSLGNSHSIQFVYLEEGDPLSPQYKYPEWYDPQKDVTAWALAKWLVEVHEKHKRIPRFSFNTLLKQAKDVKKKYPPLMLIRAIHLAGQISQYPFSFKFVKRLCESEQFPKG